MSHASGYRVHRLAELVPSRVRAHALPEGKCWRFYPPAGPLQAALRLAHAETAFAKTARFIKVSAGDNTRLSPGQKHRCHPVRSQPKSKLRLSLGAAKRQRHPQNCAGVPYRHECGAAELPDRVSRAVILLE
jgi:hypothetical protein